MMALHTNKNPYIDEGRIFNESRNSLKTMGKLLCRGIVFDAMLDCWWPVVVAWVGNRLQCTRWAVMRSFRDTVTSFSVPLNHYKCYTFNQVPEMLPCLVIARQQSGRNIVGKSFSQADLAGDHVVRPIFYESHVLHTFVRSNRRLFKVCLTFTPSNKLSRTWATLVEVKNPFQQDNPANPVAQCTDARCVWRTGNVKFLGASATFEIFCQSCWAVSNYMQCIFYCTAHCVKDDFRQALCVQVFCRSTHL